MSIVIGTLVIDLAANTASFSSSMDKMANLSAKTSNDIKRSLEKIAAAGVAMAAAIATGTVVAIKSALDSADALGKMAQAAGTTSETLSVLAYAAKLSNVENETLVKGLEKLSLAAFKAQGGNVQLERIFSRVGVTVRDSNGALKDSGVLMEEIAVKFAKMGDSAGKTALAQAIFGKAGASLIPFLNQYGSEQEKVNDEAHRFGLVLSTSTVEVAMKAHDNLDRLSAVMKGMGFSLLAATLPALDQLLEKLINIAATANLQDLAKSFGGEVVKAVHLLGDALDFAVNNAHALKIALEAIAAIKIGTIVIPIIADLAGGGFAGVGKGLEKATLGMLGIERAAKSLPKIGEALSGVTTGYYGAAKGAKLAEVAALGLETGFGKVGKAVTSLSFASVFASMTGGIGRAVTALKGLTAANMFAGLTGALSKIPIFLEAVVTGAANAGKSLILMALSNPFTAIALAITGAIAALYIFRDSTFKIGNDTYELRDTWNAAWLAMKDAVSAATNFITEKFTAIKDAWTGLVNWLKDNSLFSAMTFDFGGDAVSKWIGSKLGIPDIAKKYLDEAKRQREAASKPSPTDTVAGPKPPPKLPPPDTSGLGKAQKDVFGDEIRKLDLAIETQQKYLSVLDGSPEVIQAATAAEKAHAVIVELNNKLTDEGRAVLTARQQSMIQDRVATEESLKGLVDYGKELVSQQHSADLSIQQTRAMATANLEGDAAVRQATIDNAILGLSYNRTAEQLAKMAPELVKLRGLLTIKANADLAEGAARDIFAIRQETAAQEILHSAMLGTIDAQDRAATASKTYALNQQIAATSDIVVAAVLMRKRDAIIEQIRAQQDAQDIENARRTIGGPEDEYRGEQENLENLVGALAKAQGGQLTYMQSLQVAAQQQDIFNKATDQTVALLLREGSAADGVNAFFLDMQKQAQSTASIIYDALHSTFDKLAESVADLAVTGKNNFAQMFQDIGKQLLSSEIKKQLQEGVGHLGNVLGINLGGLLGNQSKADGSTAGNALWVRMASDSGSELGSFGQPRTGNELTDLIGMLSPGKPKGALGGETLGLPNELTDLGKSTAGLDSKGSAINPLYVKNLGASAPGSIFGGDSGSSNDDFGGVDHYATDEMEGGGLFSGLLSKLGGLFGSIGSAVASGSGGGLGSIFGFLGNLIPHAEGGSVSPSSAYLVGEKGPEILTGTSGNITSNANSRRMFGSGGDTHNHYIDARGSTDPAQVTAHIDRYMKTAGPQIAAASAYAMKDQQLRRAPSAK